VPQGGSAACFPHPGKYNRLSLSLRATAASSSRKRYIATHGYAVDTWPVCTLSSIVRTGHVQNHAQTSRSNDMTEIKPDVGSDRVRNQHEQECDMQAPTVPALNFPNWAGMCSSQMTTRKNFVSGDFELAKHHLSRVTQGRSQFCAEPSRHTNAFGSAFAKLNSATFHFFRWNCETECQVSTLRQPDHNVVLFVPLNGSFLATQGNRSTQANPGEILLVGSGGESKRRWRGGSELLSVCIARRALERTLAAEFAVDTQLQPLRFEPLTRVTHDQVGTLLRIIETMICDLNAPASVLSDPVVGTHLERTLMHIFLKSIPHNYSNLIGKRNEPAPYYVRRAEAFIHNHLEDHISVKLLSEVSGVSIRTLYYGFQKYRSLGPIKYAKRARLMFAHSLLQDARIHGGRVADIAAQSGYSSQSQFSRDYKRYFGVSPLSALAPKPSKYS
jgi:AraC-like DNA-binding protein